METTILFYEKCRLCLEQPGVHHIFDTEGLLRDILLCTGVKVSRADNLPEKVCQACGETLRGARALRLLAAKNDSFLRSLFEGDGGDGGGEDTDDNTQTIPTKQEPTSPREDAAPPSPKDKIDTEDAAAAATQSLAIRKDLFDSAEKQPDQGSVPVSASQREAEARRRSRRVRSEDGAVEYECPTCRKSFPAWKKLYLHRRSHSKPVACPLDACGKRFGTKGDLERHLRTHTGVRPYHCDICDKRFTQPGALKSHRENVHYSFALT